MDTINEITSNEGGSLIGKFSQLPAGVQRIIIAVLVLALVVAAYFLQRLMHAEEGAEPEVIPFESAAAFAAAVGEK